MTKPYPGIKIPYLQEEQYPVVEGTRCVEVRIPDDDAFLPVLAGMIKLATKAFNYQRGDLERARQIAQMWLVAYEETDWEGCMDCARIIECVENDDDVRAALKQFLLDMLEEDTEVQDSVEEVLYDQGGQPTAGGQSQDLLHRQDCDFDAAAGNLLYAANRLADNVDQVFDQIELVTDNQEMLLDWIDTIPVVGAIADEILLADIAEWFDNVRAWMRDAWEGEDDTSLRESTANDLLCIWESNGCNISFADMRDYFWQMASQANPGFNTSIGTIVDLYNFLSGSTGSFAGIWYVMNGIQFSMGYLIADLMGIKLPQFKQFAQLGEPTNDWIVWRTIYNPCYCFVKYFRPGNLPPSLVVTFGLVGVENAIVSSLPFSYPPDGDAETIFIEFAIPVTDAAYVELWMNTETEYAATLSDGTTNYFQDSTVPVLVAPDRYMIRITLPDLTGTLESLLLRTHPIPNLFDFSLIEIRVYSPC